MGCASSVSGSLTVTVAGNEKTSDDENRTEDQLTFA
jgi:hypothetical protein